MLSCAKMALGVSLVLLLVLKNVISMAIVSNEKEEKSNSTADEVSFKNSKAMGEVSITKTHSLAFHRWWKSVLDSPYDNRLRPLFGEKPLKIQIGLTILGISSFSEATMDWTVEMYFHEYWIDPRLKYNASEFGVKTTLTLPDNALNKLWTPDTSFINALRCTVPKQGSVSHLALLRVSENGLLFSARRLSVTASCHMDLTMYPFDEQACTLEMSSYGHTDEDIVYEFLNKKAINLFPINLPDFNLKKKSYRVIRKQYVAGNYSVPQICIVFVRRAGFCFLQLFIPATAVVAASWISLWLENETQFADIVSIILAIIFLSYSYNTVMPKVSYIKAMDIYLGACFIFAFLSMSKLAIVKYLGKMVDKRMHNKREKRLILLELEAENSANSTTEMRPKGSKVSRNGNLLSPSHDKYWKALKVFHIGSQLVLPLAFAGFAMFYFFVYPYIMPNYGTCFSSD